MVRVEDVAREAGVSPITVSRALSNPEKVKEETRKRVEDAVAKTGYVLNRFASSLRSGRSTIISAFVSSVSNPHFANAIQGCADALEGSRFHMMMSQTGHAGEMTADLLEEVLPFRPAAIVLIGLHVPESVREQLQRLDMPVMEVWDHTSEPIDMQVGSSNVDGGRLLGEHFRDRGYRKIAYAGRVVDRGRQRLEGFIEGLGRRPEHVMALEGTKTVTDGMEVFGQILAALPGCDAICFGGDVLAVGALLEARNRQISVPAQIAVAGYGDLDFAQHVTPSITTVQVAGYDMGRAAGEMLLRRLRHEDLPTRSILSPVRLKLRESTA